MSEKRNKGGRPRRAPGEAMVRLSVVLQSRYRDALELIARDRGTSLSQALEYLIATTARNYRIDDKTVMELVHPTESGEDSEWMDFFGSTNGGVNIWLEALRAREEEGKSEGGGPSADALQALRVLRMPESLRRPEEAYFVEIYSKQPDEAKDDWNKNNFETLGKFYRMCQSAFRAGIPAKSILPATKNKIWKNR